MTNSKQYIKFEKEFTGAVKDLYQLLRSQGVNNASYETVEPIVWDFLFTEADHWFMTSAIKSFKKLDDDEQVVLKLSQPRIVVAKTWSGKK